MSGPPLQAAASTRGSPAEAATRSGSLATADIAAGLIVGGAVPVPMASRASAGPYELLAEGAYVVREGRDVLDVMPGAGVGASNRAAS